MSMEFGSRQHCIALDRYLTSTPSDWDDEDLPILGNIQDEYTYGRSLYFQGETLERCSSVAERCGFISAESEVRKAERNAMMDVSFDEWCLRREEYDDGLIEL